MDTFWERTLTSALPHHHHHHRDASASLPSPSSAAAGPTTTTAAAAALLFGSGGSAASGGELVSPSELALFVGVNVWLSSLALGALLTVVGGGG